MTTRVILLRHGQSTYNQLGLYQGSCDRSTLTVAGQLTARHTAAYLRQLPLTLDAVYVSPLQRAQATAQSVLALGHVAPEQVHVSPLLRETHLPAWEGLPVATVRQRFPEAYRCWKQAPHRLAMATHEATLIYPAQDLYRRLRQFWQQVLPRHRHQTLLVVAHGGTNRAAIATALGIPAAHYHTVQQSNCALSSLTFADGSLASARLEAVNLTDHLTDRLADRLADYRGATLPPLKESGLGLRLLLVPAVANCPQLATLPLLQSLRSLLQLPIQFSLSCPAAQPLAAPLLAAHPETVQLQVHGPEFSRLWQRTLARARRDGPLLTGLVVAEPTAIGELVAAAIGLEQPQRLGLQPGTLSALHYPPDHPPVLQALNLGGTPIPQVVSQPSLAA